MGWLFTQGQSKKDLIEHLTRTRENEDHLTRFSTLRHSCVGQVLYYAMVIEKRASVNEEYTETDRFIGVSLLRGDKGFGWGSKDMAEGMGPCEHSCPLYLLELVPVPDSPYAVKWREAVHAHHAARKMRDALKDGVTFKLPTPIRFSNGHTEQEFTVVGNGSTKRFLSKHWGFYARIGRSCFENGFTLTA